MMLLYEWLEFMMLLTILLYVNCTVCRTYSKRPLSQISDRRSNSRQGWFRVWRRCRQGTGREGFVLYILHPYVTLVVCNFCILWLQPKKPSCLLKSAVIACITLIPCDGTAFVWFNSWVTQTLPAVFLKVKKVNMTVYRLGTLRVCQPATSKHWMGVCKSDKCFVTIHQKRLIDDDSCWCCRLLRSLMSLMRTRCPASTTTTT